jgi:hypothetical protein
VAFTYDKATGTMRTWTDGKLTLDSVASVAYSDSNGTAVPLEIGGVAIALDEIKLFDRALTESEVAALRE